VVQANSARTRRIQVDFGGEVVEDEYLGRIVHGLERINEILKLLISSSRCWRR